MCLDLDFEEVRFIPYSFSLWACKFPIWILLTQESSSSASIGATRIPLVRRFSHGEGKVGCLLPISVSEPHVVTAVVVPLDLSLQPVLSANLRDCAKTSTSTNAQKHTGDLFCQIMVLIQARSYEQKRLTLMTRCVMHWTRLYFSTWNVVEILLELRCSCRAMAFSLCRFRLSYTEKCLTPMWGFAIL